MSLESFVFSSFQQKSQLLLCIIVIIIIFDLLFFSQKLFKNFSNCLVCQKEISYFSYVYYHWFDVLGAPRHE
jgi:hypothetical protein